MTTFYWPTDDYSAWSLSRINRRPATAPDVAAVQPYPAYDPLRKSLTPDLPTSTPAPARERRRRADRRRSDTRVLFDRRSGDDRRFAATRARIDIYC